MDARALALVIAFLLACSIAMVAGHAKAGLRLVCHTDEFAGYAIRSCEVRP